MPWISEGETQSVPGPKHAKAEEPLNAWYRVKPSTRTMVEVPNEVRETYRSADPVGDEFVVFDICNNDFRLVVPIDYGRSIVYICRMSPLTPPTTDWT